MIEMPIPSDIRKYESKFIGPLTLRQFVCAIPIAAIFILTFVLIKIDDITIKLLIATIPALPFMLCGFIKVQGLPFEKFAKTVFVSQILAPTNRLYKTENLHKRKKKNTNKSDNKKIVKNAKKRKKEKDVNKRAFE